MRKRLVVWSGLGIIAVLAAIGGGWILSLPPAPTAAAAPEWIFLAREGAALVGLCVMPQIGERAYAFFTGIQPSAQRRGIARALKRASIQAARRDGFGMFTDNLSTNNAMLALNTSLGFVRRNTTRTLRKRIEMQ